MSYKVLSYPELRKVVWFIADKVRDKGRGGLNDYMAITIGPIFLKRFIDMRAEYKRLFLQDGTKENGQFKINNRDIDLTIKSVQSRNPAFAVLSKKLWTYRIEWADIANYNMTNEGIAYHDGLGGNTFPGTFPNKAALLKEVMDGFSHTTLHNMFGTLDFISKVYSTQRKEQVLDFSDFEVILEELHKYNFGLQYVNDDIFNNVYMDLLGRFAADGGKKGGEFFTPTPLVKGSIKFLNLSFYDRPIRVADLAAGACTFLVEFSKYYEEIFNNHLRQSENKNINFKDQIKFISGEKEPVSKVLGDANLLSAGHSGHISFHANSITEYNEYLGTECSNNIDIVLANPPYGINDYGFKEISAEKNMPRWQMGVPNKGEGEYAFLMTILDMLNDQGKAVVVFPLGTLFKDITSIYRQKIIEKDWLEGIVILPSNMFHTTSIPVCLWILNKNKNTADQGKIFLVNASQDFVKNGKINDWNDEKSTTAYNSRTEIKGYSGYIDLEKIQKNKYNLSVNRYISEEKEVKHIDLEQVNSEVQELMSLLNNDMSEINVLISQVIELDKKTES